MGPSLQAVGEGMIETGVAFGSCSVCWLALDF